MDKSKVSFSRNIKLARKNMLQTKLSFKAVEKIDKYLTSYLYIEFEKKGFPNYSRSSMEEAKGGKRSYYLMQEERF